MKKKRALVLFSGGQDSTTCLAWSLERFDHVETVGFDYGQRHRVELDARINVLQQIRLKFPSWSAKLGDDHVLDIQSLAKIGETALTSESEIKFNKDGLPNTFVPGRNLIFLNYAAALAYRRDLEILVGGMCETDFSGYPDCRDDAIKATQLSLSLGMGRRLTVATPLMWINKKETWALANRLGGDRLVDILIEDTHTCYLGDRSARHVWGYGCGDCPACKLRQKGFDEWSESASSSPKAAGESV